MEEDGGYFSHGEHPTNGKYYIYGNWIYLYGSFRDVERSDGHEQLPVVFRRKRD